MIPKVNSRRCMTNSTKTKHVLSDDLSAICYFFKNRRHFCREKNRCWFTARGFSTPQLTALLPQPWFDGHLREKTVEVLDLDSTEIQKKTGKANPLSIWPDFWQSFHFMNEKNISSLTIGYPLAFCWFVSVFLPPSPAKKRKVRKIFMKGFLIKMKKLSETCGEHLSLWDILTCVWVY